jgi:hypothetical protein
MAATSPPFVVVEPMEKEKEKENKQRKHTKKMPEDTQIRKCMDRYANEGIIMQKIEMKRGNHVIVFKMFGEMDSPLGFAERLRGRKFTSMVITMTRLLPYWITVRICVRQKGRFNPVNEDYQFAPFHV